MADCTTGPLGIEDILRRVIYYQDGCGILLTGSGQQSEPLVCDDVGTGLHTLANLAYDPNNGFVSSLYDTALDAELCDTVLPRFADCDGPPSLNTALLEVFRLSADQELASVNFMDTQAVVSCLACDDTDTPLLTRVLSSFVRKAGSTYILLATADASGPAPLTCDNKEVTTLDLIASCLVPIPSSCGMWAWRAAHI